MSTLPEYVSSRRMFAALLAIILLSSMTSVVFGRDVSKAIAGPGEKYVNLYGWRQGTRPYSGDYVAADKFSGGVSDLAWHDQDTVGLFRDAIAPDLKIRRFDRAVGNVNYYVLW
ncbi:hypothetical protein GCM10009552_04690 [Rothia nasimurium]|uniref:Uncharacterized protein n=1 Tax=Luteibacter anthropi TaxID=564369 RepID=A0A7X5ZJQ1_9GAMM|nr:hypothetical protein [Luteibacter anthropi]NII07971.1 hypothetical protein [Luteibacter anthropi]